MYGKRELEIEGEIPGWSPRTDLAPDHPYRRFAREFVGRLVAPPGFEFSARGVWEGDFEVVGRYPPGGPNPYEITCRVPWSLAFAIGRREADDLLSRVQRRLVEELIGVWYRHRRESGASPGLSG